MLSFGVTAVFLHGLFLQAGPASAGKSNASSGPDGLGELRTAAERTDYKATSRYDEVMAFCRKLAESSPKVRLGELGKTVEGRSIPLIILADPPVATPEEARRAGKMIVFAFGNIHAGEVCGKEALLMLARDVAAEPEPALLADLILVFAPIFNADSNERVAKDNRPGQNGPEEGMGVRHNAQDLDLNRDFVKLESPEVRGLVWFLTKWDPAVVIDTHTTNGSYHQYTMTYDAARHPAGDGDLMEFTRTRLLPEVSRKLKEQTGYESFFYGNFDRDHTVWHVSYPCEPRFSTPYVGLRNRVSILAEAYAYAPFKDRVLATRDFVRLCLECTAEHHEEIAKMIQRADKAVTDAGSAAREDDAVAIRCDTVAYDEAVVIKGFVEEEREGRRAPSDERRDYTVQHMAKAAPTLAVQRPYAYVLPCGAGSQPVGGAGLQSVADWSEPIVRKLQEHGVAVEIIREDIELDLEVYRVGTIKREDRAFQGHNLVSLDAAARLEPHRVPAGSVLVRTGQPLGSLIVNLLEPQAEDGLAVWNFLDAALAEGADYPVLRLPAPVPILRTAARPLERDRQFGKRFTREVVVGGAAGGRGPRGPDLYGSAVSGQTWLPLEEDGGDEHYLEFKDGELRKVEALTGRSQPFIDKDKLAAALGGLPTITPGKAKQLAGQRSLSMSDDRQAALFEHENDLYYARLDGSTAARLTSTPETESDYSFSPDGRFVAFTRDFDLFVVDVATQTERALTDNGNDLVRNGRADWVYFEELFNRSWRTYWWSPDSGHIAFLQIDDGPVHEFTVIDHMPTRQDNEVARYPKAGDPNPHVRLGIVSIAGGSPRWADLDHYGAGQFLISHVGWFPTGDRAYFYIQDRAQTWLDFNTVGTYGGKPATLFRETTGAWVESLGDVTFLKDGSFLAASERLGWKHLYHYQADGTLKGPVTSGEWEVRTLHVVDEDEDGRPGSDEATQPRSDEGKDEIPTVPGFVAPSLRRSVATSWVYFSGTKDGPTGSNLYRTRLDGSQMQRLTPRDGSHSATVSPSGRMYIDRFGSHETPDTVGLYNVEGELLRTLDINPVYALEEYTFGRFDMLQVPTRDGFLMEASLLLPPDFDASRKYPVWFETYAGPHAPTIRDGWRSVNAWDQMLANLGVIVFRADPRSASGKGAASAWTAYRRLGVQELADIEDALRWLMDQHPFVDADRIGISGHSYGGFMTAYALTHSKMFAAGIAGSPVTDWRLYDTIYTERYMDTPQNNPEGYSATSPVKAAADLHGLLLLLHGSMDDNVHMQNTLQLARELQKANKPFEMMIYPESRHGLWGAHYQNVTLDFILRTLKPDSTSAPDAAGRAAQSSPPGDHEADDDVSG